MADRPAAPAAPLPTVDQAPLWRRLLPWVLTLALLAFVFRQTDVHSLAAAMRSVNAPAYVAFIATFSLANLVCEVTATARAYRMTVVRVDVRTLLVVRGASYLPSVLNFHVGQAYVTWVLARVYGAPMTKVIAGTLFVYATNLGTLVLVASASLPLTYASLPWLVPTLGALLAAGAAYLVVIVVRPTFLADRPLLAPLFDAGVWGHAEVMLWRLPHVAVMFINTWVSYWFFGVRVPLGESFAYMPLLVFVGALPITPQGVGTREIVALKLLSPFVVASAAGAGSASPIVAAGLAWVAVSSLCYVAIGLVFLPYASRVMRRHAAALEPETSV